MPIWKATLPREKPEPSTAHFVLGIKYSSGARVELDGTIDNKILVPILEKLAEYLGKNPKTS